MIWALFSSKEKPIPVFLSGEFHGQRSLVGNSPRVTKNQTQLSDSHTHTHTQPPFLTFYSLPVCHRTSVIILVSRRLISSQAFINTSTFVFCITSPLPSFNIGLNLICLERYSLTVLSSLPFISPRVFPSNCDC